MSGSYCTNCGAPLAPGIAFCGSCGRPVATAPASGEPTGTGGTPPLPPPPPTPAGAATSVPGAGEPTSSGRHRRGLFLGLAAVVVLALVAAALVVLPSRDASSEVFRESVNDPGANPFTGDVSVDEQALSTDAGSSGAIANGGDVVVATKVGSEPGLYGGTQQKGSCDPDQLVAFLVDNPDKAAAWAGVLGIAPNQIADYVDGLTPVVLQTDTRVTNHGWKNGKANPLQSVLEAGTAVLVDQHGVPRVKCNCGNPLLPPEVVEGTPTYKGGKWSSFDPAVLAQVTAADQTIDPFILKETATGEAIARPAGSTGVDDGAVLWESFDDKAGWSTKDNALPACDPTSSTIAQTWEGGVLRQSISGGGINGTDCALVTATRSLALPTAYDGTDISLRATYRVPAWSDQIADGWNGKEGWVDLVVVPRDANGQQLGAVRYRVSCDDRHGVGRAACDPPGYTTGDGSTTVLVHGKGVVDGWTTFTGDPAHDLNVDWSKAVSLEIRLEVLGAFMHDDAWSAEWDNFTFALPRVLGGGGTTGTGTCGTATAGGTPPSDAVRITRSTADVDGDGRADTIYTYGLGDAADPREYHLLAVLAGGFSADLKLDVQPDPAAAVAVLGASNIGGGGDTAFVRIGVGSSTEIVALFALVDCKLVWIEQPAGGGPPTEFPVGGTVTQGLGLACTDVNGDSQVDLVVKTASSTDGTSYSWQELGSDRVGSRLDFLPTGSYTKLGNMSGDDPALAGAYTIDCNGVSQGTSGGQDGQGPDEGGATYLCPTPAAVVESLKIETLIGTAGRPQMCASAEVAGFVDGLGFETVGALAILECTSTEAWGLAGFPAGSQACSINAGGATLVIEPDPSAPGQSLKATTVVVH
jgi:hypothetical protein